MNVKPAPHHHKIILLLLILVSIVNFFVLGYSLLYASPDSIYKKNAFLIGVLFIVIGRLTISRYKSYK